MKSHLFYIVFILIGYTANAQKIVWANKNNLDKKTSFTKVVGQNKHGIYVLKHKNFSLKKYFIIEHFDVKMNLLNTKVIKIPNAELQKVLVLDEQVIVLTKFIEKNLQYSLQAIAIDSNLNATASKTILANVPNHHASDFTIETLPEKSKFCVTYFSINEKETTLNTYLFDMYKLLYSGKIILPNALEDISLVESALLPNDRLMYVYKINRGKYKAEKYVLGTYYYPNGKDKTIIINNDETYVSEIKLGHNLLKNEAYVFGFNSTQEKEDRNYFYYSFSIDSFIMKHKYTTEIDRQLVSSIIGSKYEQKGEALNQFRILKIVPLYNGEITVITEREYISTQNEVFYVSGVPHTSYAKIYNNDEVLLLQLDSTGKMLWHYTLYKTQSSANDGGYYNGIIPIITDYNLYILYNDRLSSNADVIQVCINEKGVSNKKILLNSDPFFTLIIPDESKQISANGIVIPVNQNKEFTYLKLIY